MELFIDTTKNDLITVALRQDDNIVATKNFTTLHRQAEDLLPAIVKMLKVKNIAWSDLTGIKVANEGGGFTSLRIGVITANALGYALSLPVVGTDQQKKNKADHDFEVVRPMYNQEPNISVKKKNIDL